MEMKNEDMIRDFDESSTNLLRTYPGFLWSFYSKLLNEGFTADQATELTIAYMGKIG